MSEAPRLWIPGPTYVRPEILTECARPPIGHRTPEMGELLERIGAHLPFLFGFEPGGGTRAAVSSTSATSVMEAALHGVGPRVLATVNGAFSKRWAEIAAGLGKQVWRLAVELGSAPTPEQLEQALDQHGPVDAVLVVANETSTGVRTPLEPLAQVLAQQTARPLLLVDVVTLAAGAPVDLDRLGIDFAVTGSQKALALPPGLAPFAASERYQATARRLQRPSFCLDPIRMLDGQAERKTPTTPAIGLHFALARQLEDISTGTLETAPVRSPSEGWKARFERHERLAQRTRQFADQQGLPPFPARAAWNSPTVACLTAPNGPQLVQALLKRGLRISGGYGELAHRTIRIGHLGDATEDDLDRLLGALGSCLAELA